MRKAALVLVASGLLVAACGGPGATPDLIIPTSGDSLERGDYSDAQVQVYKDAVIYETLKLNPVEGMTFDTNVPEESWNPYIVRAKALCDDARTRGWETAVDTYTTQAYEEAMNAMPDAAGDISELGPLADEILAPIVNTQLQAIAAEGSLCPELAPTGFGTVMDPDVEPTPEGEPVLDGQYFGEGCEGAGNALMELLVVLREIEDGTTDPATFEDDVSDIASGLRYAAMSEPDSLASSAIDDGVFALIGLLVALDSRDADEFMSEIAVVADQALNILEACNLD